MNARLAQAQAAYDVAITEARLAEGFAPEAASWHETPERHDARMLAYECHLAAAAAGLPSGSVTAVPDLVGEGVDIFAGGTLLGEVWIHVDGAWRVGALDQLLAGAPESVSGAQPSRGHAIADLVVWTRR